MIATIEMCAGTKFKKEYNKELGQFVIDRRLSVVCPAAYGFINNTLSEDGDALDVFIIGQGCDELPTGTLANIEIVGVYLCEDNGIEDHKIIAKIKGAQITGPILLLEGPIVRYLQTYKSGFTVISAEGLDIAMAVIDNARHAYEDNIGNV